MMTLPPLWLQPVFSAPGVRALMTTRDGGVSTGAFDSMNLRDGLGDQPGAVRQNRQRLHDALGLPTVMLNQVHGVRVLQLTAGAEAWPPETADASICAEPGLACEIQVADCMPVLMADRRGCGVAGAHAGWRGLAEGIVEATLAQLCEAISTEPAAIEVWLGACIGPEAFEVGADVVAAFGASAASPGPRFQPLRESKWLADLPGLARDRLAAAGVRSVTGNDGSPSWCTVGNPSRYFSYRRDRVTGRMAACIGLTG